MTLQQLRYAIGVARAASFSEAATKLFISQPSLSSSIKELEQEIGIDIFTRTNRGVSVTAEGAEFLGYARQVIEQTDLIDSRYRGTKPQKRLFSVSAQHYAFAVNAFVELIRDIGESEYECTLRETRTHEIIDDVKNLRSEIGILYENDFNERVLEKLFAENSLVFTPLFSSRPHVFVSAGHPLAGKDIVTLDDLADFPCLSFDQGEYNSFHFSEEIQSTLIHKKAVKVSDRATLFNLLIGLDGYTISTGIITPDLNGKEIVSIRLDLDERITVGYIIHSAVGLSRAGTIYLEKLRSFANSAI